VLTLFFAVDARKGKRKSLFGTMQQRDAKRQKTAVDENVKADSPEVEIQSNAPNEKVQIDEPKPSHPHTPLRRDLTNRDKGKAKTGESKVNKLMDFTGADLDSSSESELSDPPSTPIKIKQEPLSPPKRPARSLRNKK
jgi:hypothetical protein